MERDTPPSEQLSMAQEMIVSISQEIMRLEARRTYWEQIGHKAVAAMYGVKETNDGKF